MNWKDFFKPTPGKIALTIIIYLVASLFFPIVPMFINVLCKMGIPCPPVPTFVTIGHIIEYENFMVSVNILPLILELLLTYWISCTIIKKYKNKK